MTIKVTHEMENPLFKRKEISGMIVADKTPSRTDIVKMLSVKFSQPEANIKIKKIHGSFGSKTFNIEANVYSSPEEKNLVELKKKKEGAVKSEAK